jgi:WD40 repeat protein
LCELQGYTGNVTRLAFSPNGKGLAAAAPRETVKVWDGATGQELLAFHDSAACVAFSPDARRLAFSGREGLKVRDAVAGNGDIRGQR